MDRRPYATPEGVRTYLDSLEGLHALREERRAAAARRELMPALCALGRYVLAEDGRFGALTGVARETALRAPDVIASAALDAAGRATYGPAWSFTYRLPGALAPYDAVCEGCGRGWTLEGCDDVEEDRVAQGVLPYHAACLVGRRRGDGLWWAEDVIERAGYPHVEPFPQPGPLGTFAFGWFRVETPAGGIRFGPQPPGFGIEWVETGRDLSGRFCRVEGPSPFGPVWNEPPVDHGPFHVRPKDESWLVAYLARLRQALGL